MQNTYNKTKEMTVAICRIVADCMEIVEDKEDGGFVVFYPDLPSCITCGETLESAVENAADAKKHG